MSAFVLYIFTIQNFRSRVFNLILSYRITYIFNHSNNCDYEWFKIIRVLKGVQTFKSIEFYDENDIIKCIKKFAFVKNFVTLLFYCNFSLAIIITITTLIKFYEFKDVFRYGIISCILYILTQLSLLPVIYLVFCIISLFAIIVKSELSH